MAHPSAQVAMEIPNLSKRLPICIAVVRASSKVLQELLHAGARVETMLTTSTAHAPIQAPPPERPVTLPPPAPASLYPLLSYVP